MNVNPFERFRIAPGQTWGDGVRPIHMGQSIMDGDRLIYDGADRGREFAGLPVETLTATDWWCSGESKLPYVFETDEAGKVDLGPHNSVIVPMGVLDRKGRLAVVSETMTGGQIADFIRHWHDTFAPSAKTFHLSEEQLWSLEDERAVPDLEDEPEIYLHPPYPFFRIVADDAAWWDLSDSRVAYRFDNEPGIQGRYIETFVDTRGGPQWWCHERVQVRAPRWGSATRLYSNTVILHLVDAPALLLRKAGVLSNLQNRARLGVMNFVLLLNHRKVETFQIVDPLRPPTRQQRRAQGYVDTEHYRIRIPPKRTIFECIRESAKGAIVKHKRPHDVRGHLRRLRSGRTTTVRSYRTRDHGSSKPHVKRDYEVLAPFELPSGPMSRKEQR